MLSAESCCWCRGGRWPSRGTRVRIKDYYPIGCGKRWRASPASVGGVASSVGRGAAVPTAVAAKDFIIATFRIVLVLWYI